MQTEEKALQTKIIKYLESEGAYVRKIIVANRSGTADLLVCFDSKFISIEVKGKSKITKLQEWNIEKVKQAGGIAIVVNSWGDFMDKWLDVYLEAELL